MVLYKKTLKYMFSTVQAICPASPIVIIDGQIFFFIFYLFSVGGNPAGSAAWVVDKKSVLLNQEKV